MGAYKPELNAFFANTVAATQATNDPGLRSKGQKVHYLRTMNPINPENLAVYPRRLGTNRPNPYPFPGHFLLYGNLSNGTGAPPQFETRHCSNGVPTIANDTVLNPLSGLPLIGKALTDNIRKFAYGVGGSTPAPPCVQQGPYGPGSNPPSARQGDYPHVEAAASGSSTRRRAK